MTFDEQIIFIENNDFDTLKNFANEQNFIKYINPYAVSSLNLLKIRNFLTACVEEKFKKTKIKSKPYKLVLDPTNACNLGCPLCPTGLGASSRKKGVLKIEQFLEIIDQFKDFVIEVHLYNWGEPTMNKKLNEMLSYCKKNNLWTRISSNLSLNLKDEYLKNLVESGLNLLHVDIDGMDQEVYVKYRKKGNLNQVMSNLKKIIDIKKINNQKTPVLELAMLAMKQNEHQHKDFLKLKNDLNVDVVRIDKIQHNPNMDTSWLPENKDLIYSSYEDSGGKGASHSATSDIKSPCHWPWSGIVINYDGGVNPCCLVDDPKSDFDNIYEKPIEEIWNSEKYISSRSEFTDQKEITVNTICNVCKNETHSKRLNRVDGSFAIKI